MWEPSSILPAEAGTASATFTVVLTSSSARLNFLVTGFSSPSSMSGSCRLGEVHVGESILEQVLVSDVGDEGGRDDGGVT